MLSLSVSRQKINPSEDGVFTALSIVSRLGHFIEVQGEKCHAEAAEGDEHVLGGEGHDSRYKTLLTNVTEAQGCVVESFRGGSGRSSFLTYPFGAIKSDLEKAFQLPDAPPLEQPQKQDAAELSESDLSTVLFEHPGI